MATFSRLLLTIALVAPSVWAQDDAEAAEAKRQFATGTKAFSAGRFQDAAQAFENAAALKANAVALYTAALAWEQANQTERAADDYGRALDLPGNTLQPQQVTTAKDRLAALEKVLATLTVNGPEGYKVQLDQFVEVATPARLHGVGGTHSLSARAPGKQAEKRDIMLEGGQTLKVDVSPVAVVPKEEPPPTPPKEVIVEKPVSGGVSALKAVGFSAIGAGGIGVLAAIMIGISAQDAGDVYNRAPTHDAYVHANALATWATGTWIGAGVVLAAGVALALIPDPKPASKKTDGALVLSPSLGGLLLRGKF